MKTNKRKNQSERSKETTDFTNHTFKNKNPVIIGTGYQAQSHNKYQRNNKFSTKKLPNIKHSNANRVVGPRKMKRRFNLFEKNHTRKPSLTDTIGKSFTNLFLI